MVSITIYYCNLYSYALYIPILRFRDVVILRVFEKCQMNIILFLFNDDNL